MRITKDFKTHLRLEALPLLVYLSAATSMVSPELLNFHLKTAAGGSASTSHTITTDSPRAAPTTETPPARHDGESANILQTSVAAPGAFVKCVNSGSGEDFSGPFVCKWK